MINLWLHLVSSSCCQCPGPFICSHAPEFVLYSHIPVFLMTVPRLCVFFGSCFCYLRFVFVFVILSCLFLAAIANYHYGGVAKIE